MIGLCKVFKLLTVSGTSVINQQTRNTFVVKRRWPPPLHKKRGKPSKLRGRHFVYDLVQDTNVMKQPDLKIILNQFVEGVGEAGQVLSLRPRRAYQEFLIPGLAVYATPENEAKYKIDDNTPKQEKTFSSPYVQRTMNCLSRLVLQISMSKTEPWTLQPWHVRASFRKAGFVVPEHAIIMPPIEIKGPDLSLLEKEFFVTVKRYKPSYELKPLLKRQSFEMVLSLIVLQDTNETAYLTLQINNTEQVNVRARIHHWATGLERLPFVAEHWKKPRESLIPEQAAILEKMPLCE